MLYNYLFVYVTCSVVSSVHSFNYTAAQYPENHFAEEYEKVESFCMYPADIDKSLLRNIEILGDTQTEKLKRDIEESLASLCHHLQSRLDKLCQHDVKEIFEKHQLQNQKDIDYIEDHQIKDEIIQLLKQHKQKSLCAVQKETDDLKQQLEKVIKKQQAESKKMLMVYTNSQFETNTYLRVIITILMILLLLLIYTLSKLGSTC